jgi:GcrA cell cycle regulator
MTQQQQETLMRSTNSEFEWTDDTIRELWQLWSEGHSTAEIGRRMGISKNAVVGKAHRLDLPARPSPIRTGGSPRPPRPPRAPRRPPVPRLADTVLLSSLRAGDIPTAVERLAPLHTPTRRVASAPRRIGSHPCCWPIGEPRTSSFRFCDDLAPLDVPYCDEHARLAYKPRRRRDAADEMLFAQFQ